MEIQGFIIYRERFKHCTNGLSRFSQPSIGTIVTMDVPVFAQATVDQTDEFSRKLSVYHAWSA